MSTACRARPTPRPARRRTSPAGSEAGTSHLQVYGSHSARVGGGGTTRARVRSRVRSRGGAAFEWVGRSGRARRWCDRCPSSATPFRSTASTPRLPKPRPPGPRDGYQIRRRNRRTGKTVNRPTSASTTRSTTPAEFGDAGPARPSVTRIRGFSPGRLDPPARHPCTAAAYSAAPVLLASTATCGFPLRGNGVRARRDSHRLFWRTRTRRFP